MDLNQLYFDHQILLMQAQRTATPDRRQLHERGAASIAGRIGCVQQALGAPAAKAWADLAAHDSGRTGLPLPLAYGPPRIPCDWRNAQAGDGA